MKETEIAWTDSTFNPWWGCVKASEGCRNCYAETFSKRVGLKVWGPTSEHRRFGDKHWNEPLKWNADALKSGKPHRVFCASMADVFEGRDEDEADRFRLFDLIAATPALDWLLLTKRPENMVRLAPASWAKGWPRNVWAGTTCEDQLNADRRIPELLKVPAAVRFLSVEPMLDRVLIDNGETSWLTCNGRADDEGNCCESKATTGRCFHGIDWVIVGGESGPGARPFDLAWSASLSEQCKAAGVPYFFKQGGARCIVGDDKIDLASKKGGDIDELAKRVPWLAKQAVFRREWPVP